MLDSVVLRKFASITNTANKQTRQFNSCGNFVCILLFSFIYKNYLGFWRTFCFFWKTQISQPRSHSRPGHLTWAGCGSCQHHTPLAAQEPRLLPSPSCRRLPKNSSLPAFTQAAVYMSPLGEGEPCRVPKALTENLLGSQHVSSVNYHPATETPHFHNEHIII